MPISGGTSGKLGDRYESLWAIDRLLRIVDGSVENLTLEPIDPDDSRGVEFYVTNSDGTIEYWSVKRQTTEAAGWTLALLTKKAEGGRTILGDLLSHVERNPSNRGVFASMLAARDLDDVRTYASDVKTLEGRLARSKELKEAFINHLLPLFGGDASRACEFLQRTRTHAADEGLLFDRVHFDIRKLFYADGGATLDVNGVRGYLGDLLLEYLHRPIDRETIVRALGAHGIRRRDWAIEKSVTDRINAICDAYVEPVRSGFINGAFLQLGDSNSILCTDGRPISAKILIVGGAGAGKSCMLAATVEQLRKNGIPVVPIRLDGPLDGIITTTELGRKLLLPESPALVLAGIAAGSSSVLVIDQLDAVSIASGRHAELWSLFDLLRKEVEQYPGLSLLVGCREFDLEHDHRMRKLKAASAGFAMVRLKPLAQEQVDAALKEAGVDPQMVAASLKPVIMVPLHLSMYLELAASNRAEVHDRDELFDHFWTDKERRTTQRLGRTARWTEVIDRLTDWLSRNQELSAPQYVLDDCTEDASAMASEHVLVLGDNRYRFFHESFFDYAFARRFVASGASLLSLLKGGEQHLFRRAQVRQVLAYLRSHDWARYLRELETVLTGAGVRFHIKSLVFQWMASLSEPSDQEWRVLQKFSNDSEVWPHVRAITVGRTPWFDVLDHTGFFDSALASENDARRQEAIWFLAWHQTLETRSARVAELLRTHRKRDDRWNQYLRHVCRGGEVFHSEQMFDLFLCLIDDGTLDNLKPGFAVNSTWWTVLHGMAEKRPERACVAIAHWLRHSVDMWRKNGAKARLWQHLDQNAGGERIIRDAAKASMAYAEQLLPIVVRIIAALSEQVRDRLDHDQVWRYRTYGDETFEVHTTILSALAGSLANLATTVPATLDRILDPYQDQSYDTVAYLVLRAWTAAPDVYADRLASYLVADPRRLKVGYSSWSGDGGAAEVYVSSQAVKVASPKCSVERFQALERAIVELKDFWESKYPQYRGTMQLNLLRSLDAARMSKTGKAKLHELQAKFPNAKSEEPSGGGISLVGSPISSEALTKMSNEQWLNAMRKYAGVQHRHGRPTALSGGEQQLAHSLQEWTKNDPARFMALANQMSDELPPSYFDAILLGVANCIAPNTEGKPLPEFDQVVALLRRVHGLPNKPCGRWIAFAIERWNGRDWPEDIIDAIAWYAMNDPDPDQELWKTPSSGEQPYYGGDVHSAGMNSVRGAIAGAIARLLFDKTDRINRLRDAIDHLVHDHVIAVRSCAIEALLAVINFEPAAAISWFTECVAADPVLLATRDVEQFIHFAGYRNYVALRPIFQTMLASPDTKVVETAARQTCLLALNIEEAKHDAERVRNGIPAMRKSAADVYSTNVANETVGVICRELLMPFLTDEDENVRAEAASAFRDVSKLATDEQAKLLTAFLGANPGPDALEEVVRALEDSPVQLPDLVCRLVEQCIKAFQSEAGDITKAGSTVAMDLSKIVIRLYTQTGDTAIQSRCLNLIDQMELHNFIGLSDELRRMDR